MRLRAFTMIELLVVVVIIGVLATLSGGTYIRSLSRGRDARRVEDMKSIQKGFEMYYSRYEAYLLTSNKCDGMFGEHEIFPGGMPIPPKTGDYMCKGDEGDGTYCACAELENGADYGNSGAECNFAAAAKTHFCVQNVQ